jgi:ribosome-associated translation inhibitor RaiA
MKVPLEINLKDVRNREVIEILIREKVEKLDRMCDRIISCHVAVESIQNVRHSGHSYHLRIDLQIPPHHHIVVKRDPKKGAVQEELLTTVIREAFDATWRQIQEVKDRHRNKVKKHLNADRETTEISDDDESVQEVLF